MNRNLRLGVNIDHVATLRNARGVAYPDPLRAAHLAAAAGADGITVHLREDRRHIRDGDVTRLVSEQDLPVNLEIASVADMVDIALSQRPHACCLVPERREELTTEGGLDVAGLSDNLATPIHALLDAGIRVSLFIDPETEQLEAARRLEVPCVELHTGAYAAAGSDREQELERLRDAAATAESLGLECHAGHGLTYDNVGPIAAIQVIRELNIGHFLIGESVFLGLENAIRQMMAVMTKARSEFCGQAVSA